MSTSEQTNSFAQLLAEALALSKIGDGTRAALLSSHVYDERAMRAYGDALDILGADWVRVIMSGRTEGTSFANPVQQGSFVADILKSADVVVRPTTAKGAVADIGMYTPVFEEIIMSGTRWWDCSVGGSETHLRKLFPTQPMIDRTRAGAVRMQDAKSLRITSEAGTDLTLSVEGRIGHCQVGIVDEPGRWDNFGFGLVATAPVEDSANGKVVWDAEDSLGELLGSYSALLPEQVVTHFENGKIVRIEGGWVARRFEDYLAGLKRPEFYRIAHIGWGTHQSAAWGGPGWNTAEWESYYGCIMLHLGMNIFSTLAPYNGLHGQNRPSIAWPMPSHAGGCLLRHDLYLDDELIVKAGDIVADGLK